MSSFQGLFYTLLYSVLIKGDDVISGVPLYIMSRSGDFSGGDNDDRQPQRFVRNAYTS